MVHRHGAQVVGALMTGGCVVAIGAIAAGAVAPTATLGVVPVLVPGVLFVLGGFRESVSIGSVTLPWYSLVGTGFVLIGAYMLASVFVVSRESLVFGVFAPVAAGCCSCWIGVQYARGSERLDLESEPA